jgi:hypothetical protein
MNLRWNCRDHSQAHVTFKGLSPLASTLRLIEDIKKFERLDELEQDLRRLSLQKYALIQACSRQSQALIALGNPDSFAT